MNKENKTNITPAKGRPMLHWVGKKALDSLILERFEGGEFSLKKRACWRINRKSNSKEDGKIPQK